MVPSCSHRSKDCFDYLIAGEGEYVICGLLDAIEKKQPLSNINNLIYKSNGAVIKNRFIRENIDLDNHMFPDRELFPIFNYKGMFTENPYTQIITSRGCNNKCSYCPEPFLWGGWKGHSVENIIDEIKSIVNNFGIREFHFEDANIFGGGTERFKELCHKIINNNLNIAWQCPNGIPVKEFSDLSVLKLMAKAGCYNICLGIESFDKKIMENLGRITDFDMIKKIIAEAHKAGIKVTGYFIIGLPQQTLESIFNDIHLSAKLDLDFRQYSVFNFIPGSKMYDDYYNKVPWQNIKNDIRLSAVSTTQLRIMRSIFSVLINCIKKRSMLYIWDTLKISKNAARFLRRSLSYFLGRDIKY